MGANIGGGVAGAAGGYATGGVPGAIIGGLSGLFGGGGAKKYTNPYASVQANDAKRLSGLSNPFATEAASGQAQFDTFNPQYQSAINKRLDYLNTNPFTDAASAQQLAQATAGGVQASDAAEARLNRNLADRGLDGNSSNLIGGLTSIATNQANNFSTAQNQLAYARAATLDANQQAALALLGHVTGEGLQRQNTGLAGEANSLQAGLGEYNTLAGQGLSEASFNNGVAREGAAGTANLISGIGAALPSIFGKGAGGMGKAYGPTVPGLTEGNPFATGNGPAGTPEMRDPLTGQPYRPGVGSLAP